MHLKENSYNVKGATVERFAPLWTSNFNANKDRILRGFSIGNFFSKFKDTPGIIIGAGPSLNKNINNLKYAKDRSVIVSCDAALRILVKESIIPSFVVVLDPQDHISRFFDGIDTSRMNLIVPTIVHPKVIESWQGKIIFYNKHAPDIPVLNRIEGAMKTIGSLTPGGSVLSVCYDFLFKAGANPIIFIGQDLSYPKGEVYANGSLYDSVSIKNISRKESGNIIFEKDIYGENVATLKSMSVTRMWFDWAFSTWKRDNDLRIINCTEGGILRKNCNIMTLREAIFKFLSKKINVKWTIEKILK